MKKDDIYVYNGNGMEHPDVIDISFINTKEAIKYEKYKILSVRDEWDYCYITTYTIKPIISGDIMKCVKSSLITLAAYRKLKIENLL